MKSILLSIGMIGMIIVPMASQNMNDTTSLSELLVTAPSKTNVALTPLDVTVVSAEEIEKSTESSLLPVLQNRIPGFFVTERGMEGYGVSDGAAGTVSIRGVGSGNKVLFMIDGMPQWAGVFGHSNADTYVANGVERVEVVKGPSSILYGSNAMGGSVNIITKKQTQNGFSGRARAIFGSHYTSKFNLSTGFKKDKFSALVAGQLDRSNGNRDNMAFWLANQYINMQYSPSDHWNIGTNVDMTQSKANNPGSLQKPMYNMWTNIFRGTGSLYVNNHYKNVHGGIQAFINWGHHDVDDGYTLEQGASKDNYIFHLNDYNMGFSLFETITPWIDNDLSVGVDFQHWGGNIWNTYKESGEEYSQNRQHVNEVAGYVMMQQGFINDLLSLNAGVRLQHNSVYGNVWVPQAGFIIRPQTQSEIKFSFSKGFRSPNIRELYLYKPANGDLKPEEMFNYELSYRQTLCNGNLNFGVALYFIDAKNIIQAVNMKNINSGKFINKGFEIDATWRFCKDFTLYGGYAYLHTNSNTLLYAPKNKLDLSLTYSPGAFEFTLENNNVWDYMSVNDFYAASQPDKYYVKLKGYTLFNFRAAYTHQAKTPVTFFVKVDNFLNRKYDIVYGFPMPGVTVMGGVELKF